MREMQYKLRRFAKQFIIAAAFIMFFSMTCKGWADSHYAEEEVTTERGTHAYLNVQFKNKYITSRGLLVINNGLITQITNGLSFDVYKNKDCIVSDASVFIGSWFNTWSKQKNAFIGTWNEFDWWAGANFTIAKNWTFTAQYLQMLSPPYNFVPANNLDFVLTYDDSSWKLPLTFNPYLRLWYTLNGGSIVVTGKTKDTYYFEFGVNPTLTLSNYCFLPITLSAPTWIQFGPSSFWNGGDLALEHEDSCFGVFSTGLMGKIPLNFLPPKLGKWYADAGFQYYYLINRNLLQAQKTTLGVDSLGHAHRNVVCAYGGFGVEF